MEKNNGRYILKWENHTKQTSTGLCILMERQSLVDVAISCCTQTIHAHKCILAAHSSYLKEQFENKSIEQILFNGVDFTVIKSLIEFIYSGEIVIVEEHMKYLIAVVKLLRILSLEHIFAQNEFSHFTADEVSIPPPQFICKPPKYPTLYKPFNVPPLSTKSNNNYLLNPYKIKYKNLGVEAEKACAKEAQASLTTLSNLRKVMSNTSQVHSFIVDDHTDETTITNFISNTVDGNNYVEGVEFVNEKLTQLPSNTETINITIANNENLTTDKIKHMLHNDNVEIMFQTSDGNIIDVRSEDDLMNLAKGAITYRTVDEIGNVGEMQELKIAANSSDLMNENQENDKNHENITNNLTNSYNDSMYDSGFSMQNTTIFEPENLSMHPILIDDSRFEYGGTENDLNNRKMKTKHSTEGGPERKLLKFTPDMFFADLSSNDYTTNADQTISKK